MKSLKVLLKEIWFYHCIKITYSEEVGFTVVENFQKQEYVKINSKDGKLILELNETKFNSEDSTHLMIEIAYCKDLIKQLEERKNYIEKTTYGLKERLS